MLRPAWAFLGFLLGAAPAAAQPAFTPQGGMLFSSASVQEVAASTGAYQMFFVRDGFQILSATSTDLDVWKQQSGIRLSTSAVLTDPDRSSITSCGILPSTSPATGLQRLFYVGVSSGGLYSVLSATATDGRLFSKEPGIRLQLTGGTSFLNSPKPVALSSGSLRLYFVADSSGTNDPATYRVFSASSTDGGLTWRVEGKIIDDRAFEVSPAALSDGRLRLYYTSYAAGASTPTVLKSAISHDGVNFTQEARSSLSTSAPCGLWDIAVARSTDVYRWRLFASYTDALSSHTFISTAATVTPYPVSVSPSSVLNTAGVTAFTVNGEIFSPHIPAIALQQGGTTVLWTGVARASDLQATGFADLTGRAPGPWDVSVTNSGGAVGTVTGALFINVAPGSVSIKDNLFRPVQGGRATINLTTFDAGRVTARLYTVAGAFVATLFDADVPKGGTQFQWNGSNSAGAPVASGLYLLRVTGPKIHVTEKIVVVK